MLDFFVQDRRADGIGARILVLGELTEVGIAADGAALGFHQDREQILERAAARCLAALEAVRQIGVGATRQVFPADLAAPLSNLRLYPVKEEAGWIWVGEPEPTL